MMTVPQLYDGSRLCVVGWLCDGCMMVVGCGNVSSTPFLSLGCCFILHVCDDIMASRLGLAPSLDVMIGPIEIC